MEAPRGVAQVAHREEAVRSGGNRGRGAVLSLPASSPSTSESAPSLLGSEKLVAHKAASPVAPLKAQAQIGETKGSGVGRSALQDDLSHQHSALSILSAYAVMAGQESLSGVQPSSHATEIVKGDHGPIPLIASARNLAPFACSQLTNFCPSQCDMQRVLDSNIYLHAFRLTVHSYSVSSPQ
jgi:hypothetical protein